MSLLLGVPKEDWPGENRVALTPQQIPVLKKIGLDFVFQLDAGRMAGFPNDLYQTVEFLPSLEQVYAKSNLILQIHPPGEKEISFLKPGTLLISLMNPYVAIDKVQQLASQGVTTLALELIPRITRAQNMDVLSSQASAAGYKAVLIAANLTPKFFPMLTTAAGTIRPAKVLVIGAGVAGLQAIATAKRLGAQVSGYDVRDATREQVESLGAKFISGEIKAEGTGGYARVLTENEQAAVQNLLAKHVAETDVLITTAAIPGKKAPLIITESMLNAMKPGAVVVDLAAETGGNVAGIVAGETINRQGVILHGPRNLPSGLPFHASEMWAKNMTALLQLLVQNGELHLDLEDPILKGSVVTHGGHVCHPEVKKILEGN